MPVENSERPHSSRAPFVPDSRRPLPPPCPKPNFTVDVPVTITMNVNMAIALSDFILEKTDMASPNYDKRLPALAHTLRQKCDAIPDPDDDQF